MHTVINLIRLSPLLVDEDDGDEDDDLSHNAQEGPESSQAATHTQVDLVDSLLQPIYPPALIISSILIIQVLDDQCGIAGCALDWIPLCAIGDGLSNK